MSGVGFLGGPVPEPMKIRETACFNAARESNDQTLKFTNSTAGGGDKGGV